ncbi:MAG: hypothetical protein F3740_11740 [Nitrospinae bacterium]|nr:hypothetical protein [Nitrospinota bacterium]
MINETVDAVGLVRNNIRFAGISGMRSTVVYGWNELHRSNAVLNRSSDLFGWFNSIDTLKHTFNLDMIYVEDDQITGDSYNLGFSAIQRLGHFNTTFRINTSFEIDTDSAKAGTGTMYSSEVSWTPYRSDDIAYVNAFLVDGNYTQVGREPIVGGPLASLGILFASPGVGNLLSELNNLTTDVAGLVLGYEAFWDNHHRSLTMEIASRKDIGGDGFDDVAFGFEFRQKLAQRIQLELDASYSVLEKRDDGASLYTEIRYLF